MVRVLAGNRPDASGFARCAEAISETLLAVRGSSPASPSAPSCPASPHARLHVTTLTALRQTHGSGYSREYVREQVLDWAAAQWPELFVGRSACEPNFETHSDSASVKVTTTNRGSYAWSFNGRHTDEQSDKEWETRVLVVADGECDLLVVRNGYFGAAGADGHVAQPRFLTALVEHLEFDDSGFPVLTTPRVVASDKAFENFFDHLVSPARTLPILAIGEEEHPAAPAQAGRAASVDARSLALRVCGVAHVVSLDAARSAHLAQRLGPEMAVEDGGARLFMPGVGAAPDPAGHPCFVSERASHGTGASAHDAAYQWSVSAPRRSRFDQLWEASVGASNAASAAGAI